MKQKPNSMPKNYTKIDVKKWNRFNQYEFFKKYDNPFFNITSKIDVTNLLKQTKNNNLSFSICMLYVSLNVANKVDEFKYRLTEEGVVIYDSIYAGSTVLSEDNTFSFCYFDYYNDFNQFYENALNVNKKGRAGELSFDGRNEDMDIIHYSVIPWIEFTSFSHPRNYKTNDSIPKIVFGKYYEEKGRVMIPVSIEVHHALMDGWHLGTYLRILQEAVNNPDFIC